MTVTPQLAPSILLSPPDVGELEIEYVVAAMRSGWVAPAGPDLAAFETEMAERCGVPHAVGLASGTAALHLALVSWGIGPGDVVLTSTLTFAATANAIAYTGAEPHFVDCDPRTANLDPDLAERAVTDLRAEGRDVSALLPVDMLGKCADYARLTRLAAEHDLRMLSDAAESLGSRRDGMSAGAAGDAAVLSFNGNKVMTTSGGGMLLTRDERLASHVRHLSTQAREAAEHYEHVEIGYNYRLSNVLAALGRAQLSRLDAMIERRRQWRRDYRALVDTLEGVEIIGGDADEDDNCWLTAITIDPETTGTDRHAVSLAMRERGIETRPVWKPMHLQPSFTGASATLNGSSDLLFARGLTLPSGSSLSEADFGRVLEALQRALGS